MALEPSPPGLHTFGWRLGEREVLAVVQGIGTMQRLQHLGLNVQLKLQAQGTKVSVAPASLMFHWVSDLKPARARNRSP